MFAEVPDLSNEALGELFLLPNLMRVATGEAYEYDVNLVADEGFGNSV